MKKLLFILTLLFSMSSAVLASTNNPSHSWGFDYSWEDNVTTVPLRFGVGVGDTQVNFSNTSKLGVASMQFRGNNTINGQAFLVHGGTNASSLSTATRVNILTGYSLSAAGWINWSSPNNADDKQIILAYRNSTTQFWYFGIDYEDNTTNANLYLEMQNGTGNTVVYNTTVRGITRNNWYHVGIVHPSGGIPTFYLNGVAQITNNKSGNYFNVNARPNAEQFFLTLGGDSLGSAEDFNGFLDEFATWNKALTGSDMLSLYNAGAGIEYPFLQANDINFTVSYNSTEAGIVRTNVVYKENSTDFRYKYAVSCDITSTTLWNEQFTSFYNFTIQNVSTTFENPESILSFDGARWEDTANATHVFNIVKIPNAAYRDYLRWTIKYQTNNDNKAQFLLYDENDNVVLWLQTNKTGNFLQIKSEDPSTSIETPLGNFSLTNGNVNLEVQLSPHHTVDTNTDEFEYTIRESNNTGNQTGSMYQTISGRSNIYKAEIYTPSTIPSNTTYKSMTLEKTGNPFPEFTTFRNGILEDVPVTIDLTDTAICAAYCAASSYFTFYDCVADCLDVTTFLYDQSPDGVPILETFTYNGKIIPRTQIYADNFNIIPDYNNKFYSLCEYNSLSNDVTQRHYVGFTDSPDNYDNYHDLKISVSQLNNNASQNGTTEGGNAGEGSGDITTDVFVGWFETIGFKSTASKLFIWAVIGLIIAAALFLWHPLMGVTGFIVWMLIGYPIGMVGFWFIILFGIFDALLIMVAWRYMTGGK